MCRLPWKGFFDIYGMIVGSGIGDISVANVKAFGSFPWIGIAASTVYILIVSFTIVRLFNLQPEKGSLTGIMRSRMSSRIVSAYTLLTALTFTCGGLHVAASAITFDSTDSVPHSKSCFVMAVVIICTSIMWWKQRVLDKFCEWSGIFEILRFVIIIGGSLLSVSSVELFTGEVSLTGSAWQRAVLNAILVGIFSFAGVESAAQNASGAKDVTFTMISSIVLASLTYMLTAQASVPMVMGE